MLPTCAASPARCQVQHLQPRIKPEPSQECRIEDTSNGVLPNSIGAFGAHGLINLGEIVWPETLDPGSIQRYSPTFSFRFPLREHHEPGRVVNPELTLAVSAVRSRLCRLLELLETNCQPIAVGTILKPSRPVDQHSGDPLQPEF